MQFRSLSRRAWFHVAVVGLAVSAAGLITTVVDALDAGTPPTNGLSGLVLDPPSGDSGTTFAMRFDPPNQTCPGNNNDGFFWSTFFTPLAQDPALLTFSGSGQPQGADRTTAFRDTQDEFVRAEFPDLDTSAVIPPSFLSFDTTFSRNPVVDPGVYYVGIACSNNNGFTTEKFWATTITITAADGAGPHGFNWEVEIDDSSTTTTTTTTVVDDSTTTTTTSTGDGGTTTTVAPGSDTTTTTSPAGSTSATVTPAAPSPGASYSVSFPGCEVGETVTFSQPESTPGSVTGECQAAAALASGDIQGLRRPAQAATGTATGNFTAAPTAPGTYTITMTGTVSGQRTTTFTILGPSTPVGGGSTGGSGTGSSASTGANTTGTNSGSTGTNSGSTGTIPSTGSSTTALIVWGVLLLVFGRMTILLGRKPKVIAGT